MSDRNQQSDTDLIMSAISMPSTTPPANRRYILQEFDDHGLSDSETRQDAITQIAKRLHRKTKYRNRPIREWSNTDFVRFAENQIQIYGLESSPVGIVRSRQMMARLYDKLALCLPDMNNAILRDYIEWWCSFRLPSNQDRQVGLFKLFNHYDIARYVTAQSGSLPSEKRISTEVEVIEDDETLYSTGGLSMLVMARGIVSGVEMLKKRRCKNITDSINSVLDSFSKDMLRHTFSLTLSRSPYNRKSEFDFVSLVAPALKKHDIDDYMHIDYRKYFQC